MKQLFGDIRALGKWASVRAIYEGLHRTGVLGTVLRWRSRRPVPPLVSPFRDWPPRKFRQGWQAAADNIAAGEVDIFGERVRLTDPPDWHDDGAGGSWGRLASWRVNLYGDTRRDVKRVWELARHRHLVVLARAAVEGEPAAYVSVIETHLESWLDQNPPEVGVHWFSSLELALRVLAWLEVLALVGDRLSAAVRSGMASHIYHSGRHIVTELPYTLSSMRNNHLIGDAVGLVAIGKAFPTDRAAGRWARLGDRMLRRHVPGHVRPDGSSVEDSLGYRGFVMELLAARVALGNPPEEVTRALFAAAGHAAGSGVGSGPVTRFGDWDGGSALAGSAGTSLPAASLKIAAQVLDIAELANPATNGNDTGGGLVRVARGPWTVYLKAGTGASHQHADLLSVAIAHRGHWITGDPGNGSYNRDAAERDYFRTSQAHNVLRVRGRDQREPHRRFRWRHNPDGSLGAPTEAGSYRVIWGRHDAYTRLDPGLTVVRACLVAPDAVVVADWIGGGGGRWNLSLPLAPDIKFAENPATRRRRTPIGEPAAILIESSLGVPNTAGLGLLLPGVAAEARGSARPYAGWWADDYDRVLPATKLDMTGTGEGPVVWAVWEGRRPNLVLEATTLIVDGHRIYVATGPAGHPAVVVENP